MGLGIREENAINISGLKRSSTMHNSVILLLAIVQLKIAER